MQIGEKAKYPENWEKYTVINLVPTLRKDQIALIFDCGDSDFFLEVNKNYHEALLNKASTTTLSLARVIMIHNTGIILLITRSSFSGSIS